MGTRGLIGLPNPEEELRLLEEKANATYGAYKAALDVTADLESQMGDLKDEIAAMSKQLSEEQGNISVYTDRQAKALGIKGETEVEQEKGNRDHTIKVLQDEVAEQDEVINKLNKEKKHLSATQSKSSEDLVCAEEKVAHLSQVKSQLEATLDQLEGGLDKEKKSRGNLEKAKRKVEGDLKMAQDAVADLERTKREIEVVIGSKEKNNQLLSAKLDDEQSLVAKAQKNIKELQGRVETVECELEAERQARASAERQRSDLSRQIEQLS